jgi:16S rRNA (cytosine1402-N4)-methyltransferase
LKWLGNALERFTGCLKPGGRFAAISFHSLEDRMVKHAFAKDKQLEVLTSKPITASDEELDSNPRSRSAKLRVAQRI